MNVCNNQGVRLLVGILIRVPSLTYDPQPSFSKKKKNTSRYFSHLMMQLIPIWQYYDPFSVFISDPFKFITITETHSVHPTPKLIHS